MNEKSEAAKLATGEALVLKPQTLDSDTWLWLNDREKKVARLQRAADMAEEVACPCICHAKWQDADRRHCVTGYEAESVPEDCGLCEGAGRVTLGRIVGGGQGTR